MALQAHIKVNGIKIDDAYICILKTRSEKQYYTNDDGSIIEQSLTWAHIGGSANRESWINGDRFNLNHVIEINGELTRDQIYQELKKINIKQYDLDLTTAIDV